MTPPASSPGFLSDANTHQNRPESRLSPQETPRIKAISNSNSEESLKQEEEFVGRTHNVVAGSEVTVPHESRDKPSDIDHDPVNIHDRHTGPSRDDSVVTLRQDVYRPEAPIQYSDEKEVVVSKPIDVRGGKGEHSPPLTGKDSAYSSISGGSFASPVVHPRSASAQSSYPRAQFGLFPSSTPSTPKYSVSGRYGAASPALSSPITPDLTYLPQRPQTSLDNYNPSSRRLLKKSSLSSLKRLFSKKAQQRPVDTIVE